MRNAAPGAVRGDYYFDLSGIPFDLQLMRPSVLELILVGSQMQLIWLRMRNFRPSRTMMFCNLTTLFSFSSTIPFFI